MWWLLGWCYIIISVAVIILATKHFLSISHYSRIQRKGLKALTTSQHHQLGPNPCPAPSITHTERPQHEHASPDLDATTCGSWICFFLPLLSQALAVSHRNYCSNPPTSPSPASEAAPFLIIFFHFLSLVPLTLHWRQPPGDRRTSENTSRREPDAQM